MNGLPRAYVQRGLRIGVLGLLGLAIWNPALPLGSAAPRDVIVLLDDSLSIDRGLADRAWSDVVAQLAALPAGSRVGLVRFAAQPIVALTPREPAADLDNPPRRQVALNRSDSDFQAALEAALRLTTPGRAATFVWLTDFRETRGKVEPLLAERKRAGQRVLWYRPAPGIAPGPAWIEQFQAPSRVRSGQRFAVTATLASRERVEGELALRVDGVTHTRIPFALTPGKVTDRRFWLKARRPGAEMVEAVLTVAGETVRETGNAARIVNIEGPGIIIYLSRALEPPAAVRSLRAGGRQVVMQHPRAFPTRPGAEFNPALIIADDIAVSDMSDRGWAALVKVVRERGSGLLVLGGTHSFAAGAYRHSRLEQVLPVIAEARQSTQHAAVLFVVDKSGSMDRAEGGASRLALARQGVTDTAGALLPGDQVGLVAFDAQPSTLLPLASYAKPAAELERAWRIQGSGGTRLAPALEHAAKLLNANTGRQKLLVLVTDGFVEQQLPAAARDVLTRDDVQLIVLAIGADARIAGLRQLAGNGAVLTVDRVANLPRLMRKEVEQRRKPAVLTPVQPLVREAPPFNAGDWPALDGYMVTSPRQDAVTYLESPSGDPLLAVRSAGAGQVAVLPGGLGNWARAWHAWRGWGRFLGGMADWLSAGNANPNVQIAVDRTDGMLRFTIDALAADGRWMTADQARIRLRGPLGPATTQPLRLIAPGRYEARLPAPRNGRYHAAVTLGETRLQHSLFLTSSRELAGARGDNPAARRWLAQGLLTAWRAGQPLQPAQAGAPVSLRTGIVLFALLLYLYALAAERLGPALGLSRERFISLQWIVSRMRRRTA